MSAMDIMDLWDDGLISNGEALMKLLCCGSCEEAVQGSIARIADALLEREKREAGALFENLQ